MSSDGSDTVEVDRAELERYRTSLQLTHNLLQSSHDFLQNGRGRVSETIRDIEEILDEDSDNDDNGGGATTGYHGP